MKSARLYFMPMQKSVLVWVLACFIVACGVQKQPEVKAGTTENSSPAELEKILAVHERLGLSGDEFVVYYFRDDGAYADWALWIWALPDGDGAKAWEQTQSWTIENGVGYMRFKKAGLANGTQLIGANGKTGFVIRKKDSWTKDGETDRSWNFTISDIDNACIVFSGDDHTYAARAVKPRIARAVLDTADEVRLALSGRYGLETGGGFSGFEVIDTENGQQLPIKRVYNALAPQKNWKNFTNSVIITLKQPITLDRKVAVRNSMFEGDCIIDMNPLILETIEKTTPAEDSLLGAIYDKNTKSCRFSLWAPTSEEVSALLYTKPTDGLPVFTVPLEYNRKTGVWTGVFSQANAEGLFYEYRVRNKAGINTVLDPYAYSMAAYDGTSRECRAAIVDLQKDKLKPLQEYPQIVLHKRDDAVIYEVSVRDFTVSPDSGVKNMPGTYKAFIEKIPYLKDLGITHVQLMPVLNFYYTDEHNRSYENSGTVHDNNYNWGYDPHNYFTPEGWFASDPDNPEARIVELRELINECHKAGIGVLLDVVYNHMAKTDFLDTIVPGYYFRTSSNGVCTSASGCGNDIASERKMVRKLIVDSTVHWVKQYKADGFRFDLMGLLDTETVMQAYNKCKQINPSVLFVGEGWKMYNGSRGTIGMDQMYMTSTDCVAVFNDELRDLLKAGGMAEADHGFLTAKGVDIERLFANCIGSPQVNYCADAPGDNVQYLVCHDGLTLHDSIAHNVDLDETVTEQKAELIARIKLGNAVALTSQGIGFLHSGQECGRTKPNLHRSSQECIGRFVRNSYDASDSVNRFVWTLDDAYRGVHRYTKGLIALRRQYEVFRIGSAEKIAAVAHRIDSADSSGLVLGYCLKWKGDTWVLLFNASKQKQSFTLDTEPVNPTVFADAEVAGANGLQQYTGITFEKRIVSLQPLSVAIFRM